jgi:hypothetical protein
MSFLGSDGMDTLLKRLSIGFGLGLLIIELVYDWVSPVWWPFIVADYISVVLLLYGAFFSPTILSAGWGFACANFYRAFFVSWGTSGLSWVLVGLTLLFGLTILGLGLTIVSALRRKENDPIHHQSH